MNRARTRGFALSSVFKNLTLYAVLAITLFAGQVSAAPFRHWIAVSNTAMSITGDAQFSPSAIVFANHTGLKLTPAGSANGMTWADSMRDQPAQLYKVAERKNPRLLNGNHLCGAHTNPSFLGVVEHVDDVYLTVFSGKDTPTAKDYESRICAGFSYSLK